MYIINPISFIINLTLWITWPINSVSSKAEQLPHLICMPVCKWDVLMR